MAIRENVRETQAHNPSSFLEMIINSNNNKLLIRFCSFLSTHVFLFLTTVVEERRSGLFLHLMDNKTEVWGGVYLENGPSWNLVLQTPCPPTSGMSMSVLTLGPVSEL